MYLKVCKPQVVFIMKSKLFITLISIITIIVLGISLKEKIDNSRYKPWEGDISIAKDFGAIDDNSFTGSLEAFENSYNLGFRTFECELQYTSDDHLVVVTDWDDLSVPHHDRVPTLAEFSSSQILGSYTPVSFIDLVKLMKKYRDTYILISFRDYDGESTRRQLEYILKTTKDLGLYSGPGRIILQLYSKEQLGIVREYPDFGTFIYNTSKSWNGNENELVDLCNWLLENGVQYITIDTDHFSPFIASIPKAFLIRPYFETENILYNAQNYLDNGAWGIYTDCLAPYMLSRSE